MNARNIKRRDVDKGLAAIIAVWVAMVILNIGFWAVVVWVAAHFIRKYW
jgi:hypothetical protein